MKHANFCIFCVIADYFLATVSEDLVLDGVLLFLEALSSEPSVELVSQLMDEIDFLYLSYPAALKATKHPVIRQHVKEHLITGLIDQLELANTHNSIMLHTLAYLPIPQWYQGTQTHIPFCHQELSSI